MYQCVSSRSIGFLLAMASLLATLVLVLRTVGSALAAPEKPPEGVFLPVIMYHSLTAAANDYQVAPEVFAQDLAYLQENGYQTVSAAELIAYTEGRGELPEKPVMLTFDDGFYNNLSAALPLLEEYDMCAVVSVVGKYTDVLAPADPEVPRYSYLTWNNIRRLLDSGRIELGSHTYDMHSNESRAGCSIILGEEPAAYQSLLRADLMQLQERAYEETGHMPVVFAYPYGFICRESVPVLQECGFRITLTCREEPNYITRDKSCLYALGRYHRSPGVRTEDFFARALAE